MGAVLPPPPRLSGTDGAERGRAARSTRSSQPPPGEPRLCLRPVSPGAAGGLGLTPWGGGGVGHCSVCGVGSQRSWMMSSV